MKFFKLTKRPDQLTSVGIIEVDGKAYKVRVLSSLLVQDAQSWMVDLANQFEVEAKVAALKGDSEASCSMREASDKLQRCVQGAHATGIPTVDARLAVRIRRWPESRWDTWLRVMLQVSQPAGKDEKPEFILSEHGIMLSDKLCWLKPYCSALPVEESSPAEMASVARCALV